MNTDIPNTVFTFLQSVDAPVQTDASEPARDIPRGTRDLSIAERSSARDALRTLLDDLDTAACIDPALKPTPELLAHLLAFYKATQLYCKTFTSETCERLRAAAANGDEEDTNTFSQTVLEVFALQDDTDTEQISAHNILMDECREVAVLDFLAGI